jgi:hypothetical protein
MKLFRQGNRKKSTPCTALNWRRQVPDQESTVVGGLLSVSLPEELHEKCTFCICGGNPRMCDSGSVIDS